MPYIPCVNACIYQQDGCCRLERAASKGNAKGDSDCLYFVAKKEKPPKGGLK